MGDKIEAKRLMAEAPACRWCPATPAPIELPTTRWPRPPRDRLSAADQGRAGGGGKGMRVVHDAGELPRPRRGAARGASAFGDDTVLLERYIERPRHVEVQVLGDATATWCTCSSATARCSAATRR
jgi:acetyl/propionyl-CoA carboxylase alpha subunit